MAQFGSSIIHRSSQSTNPNSRRVGSLVLPHTKAWEEIRHPRFPTYSPHNHLHIAFVSTQETRFSEMRHGDTGISDIYIRTDPSHPRNLAPNTTRHVIDCTLSSHHPAGAGGRRKRQSCYQRTTSSSVGRRPYPREGQSGFNQPNRLEGNDLSTCCRLKVSNYPYSLSTCSVKQGITQAVISLAIL